MRKRIGQRGWRRLHYASFAAFVLALGHALTAGTDLKGVGGAARRAIAGGPRDLARPHRILMPRGQGRAVRKSTVARASET